MKVILTQDVAGTGQAGDIRQVTDGYARNFLLPRKLAQPARAATEAQIRARRDRQVRKVEGELAEARALAGRLEAGTVEIAARAGESGKLYGAVVNIDVAEAVEAQLGVTLDRRKIEFEPAHEVGEHQAVAKLHSEVEARIKVRVVAA
ncbi:MAG: 50S ribosomal protein L9 [Candidatus Dormibacteria bacterium]